MCEGDESHDLQTQLVGQYNVSNLLGVIAAMRAMGVPLAAAVRRHALHAWRLAFPHPRTGEPAAFEAPLPPDLQGFWDGCV